MGIKVLKNRLSEYVKLAAGGEIVLVTDRDRIVAELVPPRADRSQELPDALAADLVRKGWLTPAGAVERGAPDRLPIASWDQLSAELSADREDR